jgi:putative ABC transport system permease protein
VIGSLVALAWKGVRRRALSSLLTALSVALGVGLTVAVVTAAESAEDSFDSLKDSSRSFDLILGPPQGSPLQTVLVTLFHVDRAEGKFPWSVYEEIAKDPRVAVAIPFAVGDTFRGHRVVGTTRAFLDTVHGADGLPLGARVSGRLFKEGFRAVVGSQAAARTGLRLYDQFTVTHGLEASTHEHGEHWKVVGILRPTGSPHDRAIFIPIDSFYEVEGHAEAHAKPANGKPADGETKEEPGGNGAADGEDDAGHGGEPAGRYLSAVGLRLKSGGLLKLQMFGEIREKRTDVQAVMPEEQIRVLKAVVGDLYRAFRGVGWLVLAVVLIGVLVSLYTAIQGRRREIAVLRALGARPAHVFAVIVLEAVWICLAGGVLGLVLGRGAAHLVAPVLQAEYGIRIDASPTSFDALVLAQVVLLGVVAALLPAWRGLRTPIAANLHPSD